VTIQNSVNKTISVDGKSFSQQQNVQSNSSIRREVPVAAAKTGTLTTRTDNTTGTLTMAAGHGFTTGVKIDIYWPDPTTGEQKHRRNVVVGTVATNSVPISGGSGDNLPVATTPITAMMPTVVDARFDGDDMVIRAITANAPALVVFTADDDVEDDHVLVTAVGQVVEWYEGNGVTNPLAGQTETRAHVSHGDSTGSKLIKLAIGLT
jgi:hypothetical protein